eukprot:symbB.v1.2.039179.t1/scaffold6388.1/size18490/2
MVSKDCAHGLSTVDVSKGLMVKLHWGKLQLLQLLQLPFSMVAFPSCRELVWPSTCDCSCWHDSYLARRLKAVYWQMTKSNKSNSSRSTQFLRRIFQNWNFLQSWTQILLSALEGRKKAQQEVLQLLFPDLTLPSCRPGLALLALLGSRTAVTFALEDVQGRAFRYIEVEQLHYAYQTSVTLNGAATELGIHCCAPTGFLGFLATPLAVAPPLRHLPNES